MDYSASLVRFEKMPLLISECLRRQDYAGAKAYIEEARVLLEELAGAIGNA